MQWSPLDLTEEQIKLLERANPCFHERLAKQGYDVKISMGSIAAGGQAANVMGNVIIQLGVAKAVTDQVLSLGLSPILVFMSIAALYLIPGCFMPFLAVMVVTLPAIYAIIMKVGFDSIWFGIIVAMHAETGMLAPPVGSIIYIVQGIRPEIDFTDIIRGCTPFVLVLGLALVVLTPCPPDSNLVAGPYDGTIKCEKRR